MKRGMEREAWERKIERESKRREGKAGKLREMGYEFRMPGVTAVSEVPVKAKAGGEAPAGEDAAADVEKEIEAAAAEPVARVEETVEQEPSGVTVTEKKVTKKRASTDGKAAKKAKKVKT